MKKDLRALKNKRRLNYKNLNNGTNQTIKKSLFQKEEEDEMELYWSMPYKRKKLRIQ